MLSRARIVAPCTPVYANMLSVHMWPLTFTVPELHITLPWYMIETDCSPCFRALEFQWWIKKKNCVLVGKNFVKLKLKFYKKSVHLRNRFLNLSTSPYIFSVLIYYSAAWRSGNLPNGIDNNLSNHLSLIFSFPEI